jgi:RNA polymerase sigma-54 factor
MAADASLDEVMEAVKLVQSFDPPGVGAFTVEECLLLQIARKKDVDPRLAELVRSHLPEIARNKLPQIASAMRITMPELEKLLAELRKLSPYPGAVLSAEHAACVMPEAEIIRQDDGSYTVVPGERHLRLRIPERYFNMLEDKTLSDEDREYIRQKIDTARELIRSLEMRESTIRRIAGVIAAEQKDFFDNGPEFLRPMTMRQAAGMLELHETTVSRAVAGKYIQTPRGVLEFRYFFSTGYEGADGAAVSSRSIHERIRKLIADEDPFHPLSDDAISKALAQEGLSVARRTVAKYRDLLHIPGASVRRKHQ